jgi:hypothetical protein
MMWGIDYLGGARYKDLILREHPQGFAAGFFTNVDGFGSSIPASIALLETGRCPRMRHQLMWDDDHKFTENDIPELVRRATNVRRKLIDPFPNTEFRVSPCCEHRMDRNLTQRIKREIQPIIGRALYVNCPEKGAILDDCINEFHGGFKKPPTGGRIDFSFDGTSAFDSDVEAYKREYANADTFYFWTFRCNGRWYEKDPTKRPDRRGWPDSNIIDSLIALRRPRGEVSLPKNWLLKTHAEDKNTGDARANKLCFIIPPKAKSVELKASNGQVVDSLPRYGTFSDGRHRYYSRQWGYLVAEKAIRIQGNPLCEVWVEGKKHGVVNPAFRAGSFR